MAHSEEIRDRSAELELVATSYQATKRRLDALVQEAADMGRRLEHLARGLQTHPGLVVVEPSEATVDHLTDCDIVPAGALPSMDVIGALTRDIRATVQNLGELRSRLILMERPDLLEEPDEFFQ